MFLAIDIGNTNIVVGYCKGDKVLDFGRLSTRRSKTEFEYAVAIKKLTSAKNIPLSHIKGGIISSVVPQITGVLGKAVEILTGKFPLIIGAGVKTGLYITTDEPAKVGTDRISGAVGGINLYGSPLVLVDMGTATTISVINKKRQFIGGIIMTGSNLSMKALRSNTSQLPQIAFEPPDGLIGSNTISAIKSGIVYGVAASLDGLVSRIEEEMGQPVTAVATGGMAYGIIPFCKRKFIYDELLLLKGMVIIYNKNLTI